MRESLMKQATFLARVSLLIGLLVLTLGAATEKKADPKQPPQKGTDNQEINWVRYDVGLGKAKAEDKHVFIDFTAKWCGWCKKMDRETFTRPEVIEMINENFIPIKVDGDSKRELDLDGYKITEKNLTRHEFSVRGYPAFWFLKSDGTKLAVIRGYRSADYIMEALEYVNDRKYDTTKTETPENEEKPKN